MTKDQLVAEIESIGGIDVMAAAGPIDGKMGYGVAYWLFGRRRRHAVRASGWEEAGRLLLSRIQDELNEFEPITVH